MVNWLDLGRDTVGAACLPVHCCWYRVSLRCCCDCATTDAICRCHLLLLSSAHTLPQSAWREPSHPRTTPFSHTICPPYCSFSGAHLAGQHHHRALVLPGTDQAPAPLHSQAWPGTAQILLRVTMLCLMWSSRPSAVGLSYGLAPPGPLRAHLAGCWARPWLF